MKQNLVVLLADLFNLFEIHPAKCVAYPGMDQQLSSKFFALFPSHSIRFDSDQCRRHRFTLYGFLPFHLFVFDEIQIHRGISFEVSFLCFVFILFL